MYVYHLKSQLGCATIFGYDEMPVSRYTDLIRTSTSSTKVGNDWGLFAAAFAEALCRGADPRDLASSTC